MKHGAQGAQGSHFSQGSQSAHLGSSGFSIQGTHGTQGLHSEHFASHSLQKHLIQSSHFRHFSHSWHLWHFGESQFSPEGSSIHGMHGIHGAQRKQGLQSSHPSHLPTPITSVYVEHMKKFVCMEKYSRNEDYYFYFCLCFWFTLKCLVKSDFGGRNPPFAITELHVNEKTNPIINNILESMSKSSWKFSVRKLRCNLCCDFVKSLIE